MLTHTTIRGFAQTVMFVSVVVAIVAGYSAGVLRVLMIRAINRTLPKEERISNFLRWWGKDQAIDYAYRRLYPDTKLARRWEACSIAAIVSLVLAAALFF